MHKIYNCTIQSGLNRLSKDMTFTEVCLEFCFNGVSKFIKPSLREELK